MAATWATVADLRAWMDLPASGGDDTVLQACLDVAQEYQETRLDADLMADAVTDPQLVPTAVQQALLMRANALYRRRQTPDGISGVGDFATMRVSSYDPDVERLKGHWKKFGFA